MTVTEDGTVNYRLVMANLENVTAAHIHRTTGTVTTAGAVAFLYEATAPVDVHDQVVLASGTITAAVEPDLTVEELAAELVGGTSFYVNVHTTECPPRCARRRPGTPRRRLTNPREAIAGRAAFPRSRSACRGPEDGQRSLSARQRVIGSVLPRIQRKLALVQQAA